MSNGNGIENKFQDTNEETTSPTKIITVDQAENDRITADEAHKAGNLKEIDKSLIGEHIYDFYFGQKASDDVRDVLSDCVSRKHWEALLEKYKAGDIDTDDMTDVLLISHLQAGGNDLSTPEEIVDRAFESKFKGKLGRKLIANTIHALSEAQLLTAPETAVRAIVDQSIAKADHRAHSDETRQLLTVQDQAATKTVRDAADNAYDEFLASLNVTDQVRDITFDEFLQSMADESNVYFDFSMHMCFDIGWERPTRHSNEPKCLALYFTELDKAWTDTAEHNIKQSDRHVSRWLLRDVKLGETDKVEKVSAVIVEKFRGRFKEKLDFIQVMWSRGLG